MLSCSATCNEEGLKLDWGVNFFYLEMALLLLLIIKFKNN